MSSTLLIAALTAAVALVGSFVTWKVSKRNASGAIDTSVAADLWAEGGKIRGELRTDLAETKAALTLAATAVTELKDEIRLSREETAAAREEGRLSREETREMKAQITDLTAQISELHRTQVEALKEVKTGNALTIGGMADNAESRRIMGILKGDRTAHEIDHLDTASDRLPDNLAANQEKDKEQP